MTDGGRPRNDAEHDENDPELYEDVEDDEVGIWLLRAEFDRMYHGLPIDGKLKKGKRF